MGRNLKLLAPNDITSVRIGYFGLVFVQWEEGTCHPSLFMSVVWRRILYLQVEHH